MGLSLPLTVLQGRRPAVGCVNILGDDSIENIRALVDAQIPSRVCAPDSIDKICVREHARVFLAQPNSFCQMNRFTSFTQFMPEFMLHFGLKLVHELGYASIQLKWSVPELMPEMPISKD